MPLTRRAACAGLMAAAIAPARAQQPRGPGLLPFYPPIGETLTYAATQRESTVHGPHSLARAWRQTISITPTLEAPERHFRATLLVRDVRLDSGSEDDFLLAVARAIQDRPVEVRLSPNGFVSGAADWPGLKRHINAAVARFAPAAQARPLAALLDRLDEGDGFSVLARPLYLTAAGYTLRLRPDGEPHATPDYDGASAYIFPGRTARTQLKEIARAEGRLTMGWDIASDPRAAAREMAPMLREMMSVAAAGAASPGDVARARAELERTLAAGMSLREGGVLDYDVARRATRKASHRLELVAGDYRKETKVELARVEG